jgi:L-asparaginase II
MTMKTLALLAVLAAATPASAHDAKSLHGGRIVFAGNFHVEMVAKGDTIDVYLVDHNNKQMALAGYKGVAILAIDGQSQRIALETADGTKLTGKAAGALPAQPKGVVQITPPKGNTVSAKF